MTASSPDVTDSTNIEDLIGGRSKIIKLIDFGRSIDLTMYPSGTSFTTKVETSGFQCIEMKTDQPWTYQVSKQTPGNCLYCVCKLCIANVNII